MDKRAEIFHLTNFVTTGLFSRKIWPLLSTYLPSPEGTELRKTMIRWTHFFRDLVKLSGRGMNWWVNGSVRTYVNYQWKTCLIVFSLPSPCSSTLERRVSKGIFTFFTLTCQPPLFSFFLGNLQGSQKIFQTGVWSGLFGFGQYGNHCGFLHIERHTRRRSKLNSCTIIFTFA